MKKYFQTRQSIKISKFDKMKVYQSVWKNSFKSQNYLHSWLQFSFIKCLDELRPYMLWVNREVGRSIKLLVNCAIASSCECTYFENSRFRLNSLARIEKSGLIFSVIPRIKFRVCLYSKPFIWEWYLKFYFLLEQTTKKIRVFPGIP